MRIYEGANEVLRLTVARDLAGEYLVIIDAHTHVWPDKVAHRALSGNGTGFAHVGDGTLDGLRASMASSGVDRSVVLGVANDAAAVREGRAASRPPSRADDVVPLGCRAPRPRPGGERADPPRARPRRHQGAPALPGPAASTTRAWSASLDALDDGIARRRPRRHRRRRPTRARLHAPAAASTSPGRCRTSTSSPATSAATTPSTRRWTSSAAAGCWSTPPGRRRSRQLDPDARTPLRPAPRRRPRRLRLRLAHGRPRPRDRGDRRAGARRRRHRTHPRRRTSPRSWRRSRRAPPRRAEAG